MRARLAWAALLTSVLIGLAGCAEPVFVPVAGPGAPGYGESRTTPPPQVVITQAVEGKPLPDGGYIDAIGREGADLRVTGWALLNPEPPRGELQVVLPPGSTAEVLQVEALPRGDVVGVTGNPADLWAGFTFLLRGSLPDDVGICILSQSDQGAFRLGASDRKLCRKHK